MIPRPRHFMLRAVRFGPLVPARLWFCDHDPADPSNKLDRGRLSVYPRADMAGVECDPDELRDWWLCVAPGHWRYPQPVTEVEYRYQLAKIRWAETARPGDPALRPRAKVDPAQLPLPDFSRENAT